MESINEIVAKNIKQLRTDKGLSQDELARLSGVSKSMLVQIERGTGNPSLSTLWKIVNGMQVPFNAILARPESCYEIVKLSDLDPILENNGGIKNYALFPDNENRRFSIYYMEVAPGCGWRSEPHMRGTIEFVTVFSGALEIRKGEHDYLFQINKGDSIRFKADVIHSYRNISEEMLVFHNILYNP